MRTYRVLQRDLQSLRIRHEVRGEEATVELHTLHDLEGRLGALRLFHRDDALLADLFHRVREERTDRFVSVRADGPDLGNLFSVLRRLGALLHGVDHGHDGLVDASFDLHRVVARGDELGAFTIDGLREQRRGRRAVTGDVERLRRNLAHHLRAHVLESVFELDFLGHRHAVLGDGGRAEAPFEHDVSSPGPQRDLHHVGECIHARENPGPSNVRITISFEDISVPRIDPLKTSAK